VFWVATSLQSFYGSSEIASLLRLTPGVSPTDLEVRTLNLVIKTISLIFSLGSIAERMRTLFYIAVGNFIFPSKYSRSCIGLRRSTDPSQ
jgi:hypothetical protein